MLRLVLAQVRGRPRRALAMLAGVLVATTGFTVLSASTAVQQLQVDGTVTDNYRPAYDILVRPKGSRTALEEQRGLVQPNYLSGLYGGITMKQLDQVRGIGHVDVAAPVAMLGYTVVGLRKTYDLTDQVAPTARRQLLRITPDWATDRGLTTVDDAPKYVYLTRNELVAAKSFPQGAYVDGTVVQNGLRDCVTYLEVEPGGRKQEICTYPSEARLVGLDDAVVDGRYLAPGDESVPLVDESVPEGGSYRGIPSLIANTTYVDEQLDVSVSGLDAAQAATIPGKQWADWVDPLNKVPGNPTTASWHESTPPGFVGAEAAASFLVMFQPGPVDYRTDAAGALHPKARTPDENLWKAGLNVVLPPRVAMDESLRPVHQVRPEMYILGSPPAAYRVGTFDPRKLRGFTPLSGVPLETYQAPEVVGADTRSRTLLHDKPLLPNSNPSGYLTTPPLVLTNLNALKFLPPVMYDADPISAIRERVAGVTGIDARSQELVRSTAEKIATTTGLDVDITIGSSPAAQTVVLPAGPDGRPELTLTEQWSRKGVAVAIVQAADRKSVVLFGLILVVCMLFLGNAVAAAVRDRRRDLAILACLGWSARRLAGAVYAEVVMVGLVGGLLSGGAALGLDWECRWSRPLPRRSRRPEPDRWRPCTRRC